MLYNLLVIVAAFTGFWLVTKIFPEPKDRPGSFWTQGDDELEG